MGIWFEPFSADQCCLCGAQGNLTGEHKFKASALKKHFGSHQMVIGKFDGQTAPRLAQGPKSNALHFSAKLCADCNNNRTQKADREFDRFRVQLEEMASKGVDLIEIFSYPRHKYDTSTYLDVFRYFAKILSCHIAESGGPRPIEVVNFARGVSDRNVILLSLDLDPTYRRAAAELGDHSYAAHGGLMVPFDKNTLIPTGFQSSLTFGSVRYTFSVSFDPIIGLALRLMHRQFYKKCKASFRATITQMNAENKIHH